MLREATNPLVPIELTAVGFSSAAASALDTVCGIDAIAEYDCAHVRYIGNKRETDLM